jgi:hypothetical protein
MEMSEADETAALHQRFPKPAPSSAAFQALAVLGTNAWLLVLLLRGQASPSAFALYGVIELVLLSVVSNAALYRIPVELRVGRPDVPPAQRVGVIVAMSLFLFGIAWIAAPDRERFDRLVDASPWAALDGMHILWPLLGSVALAVVGAVADRLRWNARRGPFVTGAAMSAAPKFMTAIAAPLIAALLSATVTHDDPARGAFIWGAVYLGTKCGLESLVLAWQCLGMPERAAAGG